MRRLLLAMLLAGCVGETPNSEPEHGGLAGERYDLEGLARCSRLSALTSWQGSCEDALACAWAPELDDEGVCALGCDTQEDCPDGSACRTTADGDGWVRSWCAPLAVHAR